MIEIAIIALAVWLFILTCSYSRAEYDRDTNEKRIINLIIKTDKLQTKLNKLEDYMGIYWKNYSPNFPRYEKKEDVCEK